MVCDVFFQMLHLKDNEVAFGGNVILSSYVETSLLCNNACDWPRCWYKVMLFRHFMLFNDSMFDPGHITYYICWSSRPQYINFWHVLVVVIHVLNFLLWKCASQFMEHFFEHWKINSSSLFIGKKLQTKEGQCEWLCTFYYLEGSLYKVIWVGMKSLL